MLERTRHTIRKNATICLAGLAFTAAAIPAAAYASTGFTYYGCGSCTLSAGGAAFSGDGYLARDYNRIYRPIGYDVRLGYYFSDGSNKTFDDATHNPFVQNPSTAARVGCTNESGVSINPATCQSTEP